jgi:hypothetical protein
MARISRVILKFWDPLAVAAILKNPAYAGAFVYGRTRMRKIVREGVSSAKARGQWRNGGSS